VHLRLPRALVEEVLRAQCYVDVQRFIDGSRDEIPFVRGKAHGIVRRWRADGSRWYKISYVNGKAHGTATWWRADGSRWYKISYVNGKAHGKVTWWRADGTVEWVEEWKNGEQCVSDDTTCARPPAHATQNE